MSEIIKRSIHQSFDGKVGFYTHKSRETGTDMNFSVFIPSQARVEPVPGLFYLAGLTCTDETFMIKAGAQQYAARRGLALICPDTSPRGANIPGEDDDWDFGTGAGFYLDAELEPWSKNYRMYSYITQELVEIIRCSFPINMDKLGIFGHSMGGHGALTIHLKKPELFKTVSAFSPISAPIRCPWGKKAFTNYLGADEAMWRDYDATELIKNSVSQADILVDQGLEDGFLEEELHPHFLEEACRNAGRVLNLRRHEGYDHGYYFISSFVKDHLEHHSTRLEGY